MSLRSSIGDAEYTNRRIPTNPKYQNIKTKLDTGNSMSKYMERLDEMQKR